MPDTCAQCGANRPAGASSCVDCGASPGHSPSTFVTLRFPAEQPAIDTIPLDAKAAAPVLMPVATAPPIAPPAPEPRPTQQGKLTAIIAAGVVAAALVTTVALVVPRPSEPGSATAGGSGGSDFAPSHSPSWTTTTAPAPAPTDEESARRLIENEAAGDRAKIAALDGEWVPQLSSKKPGLKANGTTYDYRAIWADFQSLRSRYPGALLLWSGDYASFRAHDYWVTVADEPTSDGVSANYWCENEGIGKDDCYAKRITHTGDPNQSTLLRK